MNLQIDHRVTGGAGSVHVLTVAGELDFYTAGQLREQLTALTSLPEHQLVLDLSGVSFMDSSGVGALAIAARLSRSQGGQLRLAGLRPSIAQILTITGLLSGLSSHPDVDAAAVAAATAAAEAAVVHSRDHKYEIGRLRGQDGGGTPIA